MKKLVFTLAVAFTLINSIKAQQCSGFEVQSILVDACQSASCGGGACTYSLGTNEGQNEMVEIVVGSSPLTLACNTTVTATAPAGAGLIPTWPNNSFKGWEKPSVTSSLIAYLNTTIIKCGYLKEPDYDSGTNELTLPANATVFVFTSTDYCYAAHSYANLQDTIYVLFQVCGNTSGHFANTDNTLGSCGSGTPTTSVPTGSVSVRTLKFAYPATTCTASVAYDRSLLVNQNYGTANPNIYGGENCFNDGSTVLFDASANATYVNIGCTAPYIPISIFTPNASPSACNNTTPTITGVVSGPAVSYTWATSGIGMLSSPTSGTLSGTGSTTLTPTYTPGSGETGAVTFTLSAMGKCSLAVETSTVSIYFNAAPTPTITSSNGTTLCSGNGTVLSAISTGTLSATYLWNPGSATTSTISVTNPSVGTHTYSVTETNACGSNNATFTITVNPLPTITTVNDSVCVTGTGTVSASGVLTYTWNTGVQTSTLSGSPNTYTVTGTDGNGCVGTATAQVVSVSLPTINTDISAICEGVSSTINASGGTSYTWTPGNTNGNSLTITPSGTMQIVVTGSGTHGCLNTHTVTVNATPTISVNSPSTCSGNAVTLQATPSTLSTYTWTGVTSSASSATVAPSGNTSYTVQGTDANGCVSNEAVSNVSITTAAQISVVSTSTAPCIGSSYTLSANGATTYTWTPSSGIFTSLDGNNTQISVNQGASAVTFTVTGTGACPATPTVVTINPAPVTTLTISSAPSASVCAGNTITLTASGANSYTWNPAITNGTAFTPTTSATYSVDATDENGCLASSTINVTVYATPTISVNSPSTCSGTSVTLSVTPSTLSTYTWTGVSSSTSTATVSPGSNTSYTVQGTDANGCVSNEAVSNVTISSAIQITASSTSNMPCVGSTYTISANGATTYTWVASSGTFTPLDGNNTQISVTQADANPITFTVLGTGVCAAMPTTITINPAPVTILTLSASPSSSVCAGSIVALTASGALSYTWNPAIANGTAFAPAASATYSVSATDANGCMVDTMVDVTVYALPNITITPSSNSICSGSTVTLTAGGAGATGTYTWNTISTSNPITDNPTANTSYTVVGTDANGCMNMATTLISITQTATPLPISGSTVVCAGSSITLSAPSAGIWVGPSPLTNTISTSSSASITQGGVYSLIVLSSCGNAVTTYTVMADSVMADFSANPTSGEVPLTVTFTNTSVGVTGSTLSYTWTYGDGATSTLTSPTETYTIAGSYNAVLMVSDGLCNDTKAVTIVVNELPSVLIIPNIFTPNGDGVNDNFFVTATNITDFECKIYDRWGLLLYNWGGLSGFWDGKGKSGNLCTDGTYYYLITYTDTQGQQKKEGFFTLIR